MTVGRPMWWRLRSGTLYRGRTAPAGAEPAEATPEGPVLSDDERDQMTAETVAGVRSAVEAGDFAVADHMLRATVHAGVSPIHLVLSALMAADEPAEEPAEPVETDVAPAEGDGEAPKPTRRRASKPKGDDAG